MEGDLMYMTQSAPELYGVRVVKYIPIRFFTATRWKRRTKYWTTSSPGITAS